MPPPLLFASFSSFAVALENPLRTASDVGTWTPELESEIQRMQARWPEALGLQEGPPSNLFSLPFNFAGAFPTLERERLSRFAVGCRLFAGSIFSQDRILDGVDGSAVMLMRSMALQAEAYQQWHALFAPAAGFWPRLRSYLSEYAWACIEEQSFTLGQRTWEQYDEALGVRLALGKNCLSRAVIAGLVELSGDEGPLKPLERALDSINLAAQHWDDVRDWKEDLRRGVPSVLLARVVRQRPSGVDAEEWKRLELKLARRLYYEGHVSYVLGRALVALDSAEALMADMPGLEVREMVAIFRRRIDALKQDLEQMIARNLQQARDGVAGAPP